MGILAALERRASPENPTTNLANPASWLVNWMTGGRTTAGTTVNEITALNLSAVYAAVRILSDTVASIPLIVYRRLERGKERAPSHRLYRLLHDRPNPEMSAFTFREALQGHIATWGNAYAEIERDGAGRPVALWPLLPDRTRAVRVEGVKRYITRVDGVEIPLRAERVFHIPGFGFDGLSGYSPITLARESLGLTKAAEEYGARFFSNGSSPAGVITTDGTLGDDARKRMKASWQENYGGLSNAHRVAILEQGVKWQQIGLPQKDAQFLETRKFQVTEVARWFKVPPHMIADMERSTFSNIEQQSIDFVVHTARPWFVRWEQILNWDLFGDDTHFVEFLMDGLMRGDSTQRAAFYNTMYMIGAMSINDIRERENMNPVEGGDQHFVPQNMAPLDMIAELLATKNAPAPAPTAPATVPDDDEEEDDERARALAPVLLEAAHRMIRREGETARRAMKKGCEAFRGWVDEFYATHPEYTERVFAPGVRALAALTGSQSAAEAAEYARLLAVGEAAQSAAAMRNVTTEAELDALIATWERERADAIVRRELKGGRCQHRQ